MFQLFFILKLCSECANIEEEKNQDKDKSSDSVFNNLIFLVRDWELDDTYGERKGEFEAMVRKL